MHAEVSCVRGRRREPSDGRALATCPSSAALNRARRERYHRPELAYPLASLVPGAQVEARDEVSDGREIHRERVARLDGGHRLEVGLAVGVQQGSEIGEVLLEAARRDRFEHDRGFVGRVPEGVWDAAGLDDELA